MLQEPDRLSKLMQLLLGTYVLGGKTTGLAGSQTARLEQLIAQNRSNKRQQLSQIPIVGHLVGGLT